ncbi:MAG: carboxypeptidase-like regulatory domain-containing protein [Acidobacteriota bacterium]|nr:carboxypeptidase-like regulatory domain-containing protein [Acidobacteriota bacterium]MDP2391145.1 carboxypeptidase-like regulatory domain-containing protein [Acidobacteriota bacterium]
MRKHIFAAICGALAIGAVAVSAQQSGTATLVPRGQALKFAEPWRPNGASGATRIIGTVIDIQQTPVAKARVRLRNLATGNIDLVTESNENGEYEFEMDSSGSYVVEMVLVDGFILSLSNAGSVARFETLQTVIQLPGRWDAGRNNMTTQQGFGGFLGMSAATSMTSGTLWLAAQEGVSAANSGEPVSP